LKKIKNNNGSTIQLNFRNLKTALNKSVKLQLLNDNPCRFVEMPKKNNFKGNYLTVEEFNLIYNSLDSETYLGESFQVLLDLAVETGCRRGEMCGTEWKNIDFENKTITFNQALIKSEYGWIIGNLKTETSYRALSLSDNLIDQLKKLHIQQLQNKKLFKSEYHLNVFDDIEYDLICIQRNGKFMIPNDIADRLRALLKRNKIDKNIRWHDLRHTSATLLLENGVAMKTIQKRLGHASMSTTSDIYSHVTEKMDREATNILSRTIKQT
jgi:integrase